MSGSKNNITKKVVRPETLYQVLGMTCKTFEEKDVSRNVRNALFHLHPDKNKDADEMVDFKRAVVTLASKVLKDASLREKYNLIMQRDYEANSLSTIADKDYDALRLFEKKIERVMLIPIKKTEATIQKKKQPTLITHMRGPSTAAAQFILHMIMTHYAS